MKSLKPYIKLLRPHQWIKSSFVFVGLLFGHVWSNESLVENVLLVAAAFAMAASAVYVTNDRVNRGLDRVHPEKRHRPLASGAVNVIQALLLSGACLAASLILAYMRSTMVLYIVLAYVMINMAYSMGLKHLVLLDVFIISAGFMMRILAGTLGVGITPSHWLLLCGLMLTLFLGFAKRRAELNVMAGRGGIERRVLDDYDPVLLDMQIGICAAAAIISYNLYTVSAETLVMHGTDSLIYTVPFLIYGIFRYLFLLHRRSGGRDPAAAFLCDAHLLVAFFAELPQLYCF